MAIKSKKPRSKPKQVARAPRREPVAVPTPFLSRRWVQAVAVFIVGVFAMTFFVWLTNGLRSNDAEAEAAAEAATKRQAAIAYQTAVEDAFGTIGVINEGIVPAVFPDMLETLQQMKDGATPKDAATVFQDAATGAKDATDAIVTFDVSGQIADQGFNVPEATLFTSSAQQLSVALLGFQRCAEGGARAAEASGARSDDLLGLVQDLCDGAQAQLSQGWSDYQAAVAAGGIVPTPGSTGSIPGLEPTG